MNRDQQILEAIYKHRYLRTDHIAEMFFKTIKNKEYRQKKAAARLRALHKQKLLNRAKFPSEPYIHYIGASKFSAKMMHYLAINDVYVAATKNLPSGTVVLDYKIEYAQDNIQTDLYFLTENKFTDTTKRYYIEVELDSSASIENKIMSYEEFLMDMENENKENAHLIIVYKNKRSLSDKQFDIPVHFINLRNIEEWKWY